MAKNLPVEISKNTYQVTKHGEMSIFRVTFKPIFVVKVTENVFEEFRTMKEAKNWIEEQRKKSGAA